MYLLTRYTLPYSTIPLSRPKQHTPATMVVAARRPVVLSILLLALLSADTPATMAIAAADTLPVLWYAPFFSGGGYCSEATAFALGLMREANVDIGIVHFGDSYNGDYVSGLDADTRDALAVMAERARSIAPSEAIVVCHAEPGAWHPSPWGRPMCPPRLSKYKIGRTMFETDRIPTGWDARLNGMDEVWVPSLFNKRTFAEGGADLRRLQVVGEPVDISFFDPSQVMESFALPDLEEDANTTVFLSIFKWEARKGWDVLLESYFREFSSEAKSGSGGNDDVALYILTTSFHSTSDFEEQVEAFARERLGIDDLTRMPPVRILRWLPQDDIPRLYAAATALVQPSRGEGWGRPHAEAMAMGVPVVATNWSGSTEFLKADNSFLIAVEDELVKVGSGAFRDHKWAQPSVASLRGILREIHEDHGAAAEVGKRGQRLMRTRYSPGRMATEVKTHLDRIGGKLAQGAGKPEL